MGTVQFPIAAKKAEIISAMRESQVVIVAGDTGSGKTTQIPIYLSEMEDVTGSGKIAITEPRRIAAKSVSEYVAKLLGVTWGNEVGYKVRFDGRVGPETKLVYMTDGILLREIQEDPYLAAYSAIVVDEAHERSLNIDFLLGLLKQLLVRRPELRIVVASATIDTGKFSRFFDGAPIINVSGRCYPVKITYHPVPRSLDERQNVLAYTRAAADHVRNIHLTQPPGDMLVFMSGMDDIKLCIEQIEAHKLVDVVLLIAHSDMSRTDQANIMRQYPGKRKVVVGTNIMETGITIDGAIYSIDCGYIKQTGYSPETGLTDLLREEHSRAGCDQRAGRTGRTQPGYCIRLYSEDNYRKRLLYSVPEILRTELSSLVLAMKSIDLHDIHNFDFIDRPELSALTSAYQVLVRLGAIGDDDALTQIGYLLGLLPIEPQSGRMIVQSLEKYYGCVDEVLTVVAFRALPPVFARPIGKEHVADRAKSKFVVETSDFLTWLRVWEQWNKHSRNSSWADQNFLKVKVLREVAEIRKQLTGMLIRSGFEVTSNPVSKLIAKCVASGLVDKVCRKVASSTHKYLYGDNEVYIFPGSAVQRGLPRFFVCNQLRNTGLRTYGIDCQEIKAEWLYELAPQLCDVDVVNDSIVVDPQTDVIRAHARISFGSLGEIRTTQSVCWPGNPEHANLKRLYGRVNALQDFMIMNREHRFTPESLSDFDPGEGQLVLEADATMPGSEDIMVYPYVRSEMVSKQTVYFRGFTEHALSAREKTSRAKVKWQNSGKFIRHN